MIRKYAFIPILLIFPFLCKFVNLTAIGIIMRIQIFPEWNEDNGSVTASIPKDAINATLNIWKLAHNV